MGICNLIKFKPLSANPTKWSNTLKQFLGCCRRLVWARLIIFWGGASRVKVQHRIWSSEEELKSLGFFIFISLIASRYYRKYEKCMCVLRWQKHCLLLNFISCFSPLFFIRFDSFDSKTGIFIFKGCVRYIFARLFCMPKREHFRNREKYVLFHFESSSPSWGNQILTF